MTQVNLSGNEIFNLLCDKCQEKVVAMVKDKLTDQAIRESLEGKPPEPAGEGK